MTLKTVLSTINKDNYVDVMGTLNDEYFSLTEKVYRIEWHHKELLDLEVKRIGAEDSKIVILLG